MRKFGRNRNIDLILKHFTCMWILTVIGVFIGTLLPPTIVIPLSITCLILLIITSFLRSIRLANFILYSIPFLMGILLFWVTQFFINVIGKELVLSVFIGTTIIFLLLALLGLKMNKDMSNWGTYLFAVLVVIIVFSIIFMFVPISNTVGLVFAGLCVLLFALYTVYDFNLIRHNYVRDDDVIGMALNLYLDFVNLFTNILEIIWRIRE